MGDGSIPRLVRIQFGVKQVYRHAPDVRSPDQHMHRRIEERHSNGQRLVILVADQRDRIIGAVQNRFVVFLPAIVTDSLRKIAPRINQAHRYNRNRQVAALFDVIASQDSQATRI